MVFFLYSMLIFTSVLGGALLRTVHAGHFLGQFPIPTLYFFGGIYPCDGWVGWGNLQSFLFIDLPFFQLGRLFCLTYCPQVCPVEKILGLQGEKESLCSFVWRELIRFRIDKNT